MRPLSRSRSGFFDCVQRLLGLLSVVHEDVGFRPSIGPLGLPWVVTAVRGRSASTVSIPLSVKCTLKSCPICRLLSGSQNPRNLSRSPLKTLFAQIITILRKMKNITENSSHTLIGEVSKASLLHTLLLATSQSLPSRPMLRTKPVFLVILPSKCLHWRLAVWKKIRWHIQVCSQSVVNHRKFSTFGRKQLSTEHALCRLQRVSTYALSSPRGCVLF